MSGAREVERRVSQEMHPDSCLVLEQGAGPLDYRVEPGDNLVLVLDIEEVAEGTSICLCRELVLEIAGAFPFGEELDNGRWLVKVIYRYGDRNLQFESASARGTLTLQEPGEDGRCHGQLNLTFTDPHVDLLGVREAPLALRF